jgi:AcrR family transcriptional regulator
MPPQQRPRSDQARAARGAWQVTGRRRQQRAIRGTKLRPRHLATQHLELMAQDQQLEVLDVQPTATSDDRAQQGPEREVEKRESHTGDRSSPRPEQARPEYWRPSPINEARRAELLHEVVDYVIAHGLSDLSLRPLATELGVTPTTLVHHFGTKEELLQRVLNGVRERILDAVEVPAGDRTPEELLWAAWEWISAEEHLALFRLFFEIYGRALREPERFALFRQRVVDEWLQRVTLELERQGIPSASVRRRATLGVALTRGLLLDLLTTGDRDRVEDALRSYLGVGRPTSP